MKDKIINNRECSSKKKENNKRNQEKWNENEELFGESIEKS